MAVKSPSKRRRRTSSPLSAAGVVVVLLIVIAISVLAFKAFGRGSSRAADVSAESSVTAGDSSTAAAAAEIPEETDSEPSITVCLDAGHGGKDPGCSYGDNVESTQVLEMALAVRDAMEKAGITVIMTRDDDTFVELQDRAAIANAANADYFISIHRNTLESGHANGIELYYAPGSSDETISFAETIESKLVDAGVSRDRGASESSLVVCRLSKMPAVLVEMGYVIDDEDNKLFYNNMDAYAQAFTEAVLESYQSSHTGTDTDPADAAADSSVQ